MAVELELKLGSDPDTLDALSATALPSGWQAGPWQVQKLGNAYYDTDDLELRERGLSLRLRRANDRYVQTIKSAGRSVGGLHQRNEWNAPVQGPDIDVVRLPETEWTPLLTSLWRQRRLARIFSTDFERRSRELRHVSGCVIEQALDVGAVHADEEQWPISEMELELIGGDAGPLFALARELASHHPLHPDNRSKAECGYRLLDALEFPQTRLTPTPIADGATAWQVFCDTFRRGWSHWQQYEKEFVSQPGIDSAEQMRRALCLLRHAYTCYHRLPLPAEVRSWRGMITGLLRALDWTDGARAQAAADQLVRSSLGEDTLPHQEDIEELLPEERDFADGIERLQQVLGSREYCLFALDIAEFFLQPPTVTAGALLRPIAELATPLVIRQWQALQQEWEQMGDSEDVAGLRRQTRYLQRAIWSGLLFGDIFASEHGDRLIDPCRDLLAGLQDEDSLNCIEDLARQLEADQYADIAQWLAAQRETLRVAMRMTREFALKAEPQTLKD